MYKVVKKWIRKSNNKYTLTAKPQQRAFVTQTRKMFEEEFVFPLNNDCALLIQQRIIFLSEKDAEKEQQKLVRETEKKDAVPWEGTALPVFSKPTDSELVPEERHKKRLIERTYLVSWMGPAAKTVIRVYWIDKHEMKKVAHKKRATHEQLFMIDPQLMKDLINKTNNSALWRNKS